MSMITEQVKRLRDLADVLELSDNGYETLIKELKEAANTIEQLSAKVRKENGFIFPENATNGDVIKAIFSDNVFAEERWQDENGKMCTDVISDNGMTFTDIWWNSPYKRGDTE